MQKTKLGVSVGLMGAAICFLGLFGSYTPVLLALGYILLREQDAWLKLTTIKVLTIMVFFDLLNLFVDFVPNGFDVLTETMALANVPIDWYQYIAIIVSIAHAVLYFVKAILLLRLGLKALTLETIPFDPVDRLISQNIDSVDFPLPMQPQQPQQPGQPMQQPMQPGQPMQQPQQPMQPGHPGQPGGYL